MPTKRKPKTVSDLADRGYCSAEQAARGLRAAADMLERISGPRGEMVKYSLSLWYAQPDRESMTPSIPRRGEEE